MNANYKNMINNIKEENKMKYRITKVNGEDICGIDYATLCEHCGKHFVIASPFEGIHNYCNKCVVDIDMATRTDYVVLESGVALCYSFECVCEHSGKCGSCPIMLGYDEACAHAHSEYLANS